MRHRSRPFQKYCLHDWPHFRCSAYHVGRWEVFKPLYDFSIALLPVSIVLRYDTLDSRKACVLPRPTSWADLCQASGGRSRRCGALRGVAEHYSKILKPLRGWSFPCNGVEIDHNVNDLTLTMSFLPFPSLSLHCPSRCWHGDRMFDLSPHLDRQESFSAGPPSVVPRYQLKCTKLEGRKWKVTLHYSRWKIRDRRTSIRPSSNTTYVLAVA